MAGETVTTGISFGKFDGKNLWFASKIKEYYLTDNLM